MTRRALLLIGPPVMGAILVTALRRQVVARCGTIMGWFRRGLPLAVEVIMLLGSARLAATLLANQGYFERFSGPYGWLVAHGAPFNQEWVWGTIAAGAAVMKLFGIMLSVLYRRDPVMTDLGYGFRLLGWLFACIVWGALAMSLTVWDAFATVSIASSCALALALWGLLMGPAMPDDECG